MKKRFNDYYNEASHERACENFLNDLAEKADFLSDQLIKECVKSAGLEKRIEKLEGWKKKLIPKLGELRDSIEYLTERNEEQEKRIEEIEEAMEMLVKVQDVEIEVPEPDPCNKCSCHKTGKKCDAGYRAENDSGYCCDYSPNCPM